MIFSEIPFKIKDPMQMSTRTTRYQIFNEIRGRRNLFQVGCGSGSISLDFLLNGGGSATLLDHDGDTCHVAVKNAEHNNLNVDVFHSTVQYYISTNTRKFDAIVISTAFLTREDTIGLIENCLETNGTILTILKEDVIIPHSLVNMKETIRRCDTDILKPIVNPEDDIIRLIYRATKRPRKIKMVL